MKSIFFIMFLFAVGFGVGPQFVRGIATDGAPQAIFAVVVSVLCLLVVYIAAIVSGYGPGLGAGLLAGAQTISASIGLATDAINQAGLTPEEAKAQLDLIPVAYAITYLFGTIGTGWILAFLGPKLLGVDIAAECARYEREMSGGAPKASFISARRARELRAYTIREDGKVAGMTVAAAEGLGGDERLFVEGVRSGGQVVPFTPETVLRAGDVVAISGRREVLVEPPRRRRRGRRHRAPRRPGRGGRRAAHQQGPRTTAPWSRRRSSPTPAASSSRRSGAARRR